MTLEDAQRLEPGDVVQFDPGIDGMMLFAGCYFTVTEVRSWGVIAWAPVPEGRAEMPGQAFARIRPEWIEYVGRASWIVAADGDDETGRRRNITDVKTEP